MTQTVKWLLLVAVLSGLFLVVDFEARYMDKLIDSSVNYRQATIQTEWFQIAPTQRAWQNYYESGVDTSGVAINK